MKKLIPISVLIIILLSCNKKDESSQPTPNLPVILTNPHFPMSIDSYWVYEFQNKSVDGSTIGTLYTDTIKIIGDTIIEDHSYFIFTSDQPTADRRYFLRDSSAYILNQNGDIYLPPSIDLNPYNFHYNTFEGDTVFSFWIDFNEDTEVEFLGELLQSSSKFVHHNAWPQFGGIHSIDSNYYAFPGQIQRSYAYLSGARKIGVLTSYYLAP